MTRTANRNGEKMTKTTVKPVCFLCSRAVPAGCNLCLGCAVVLGHDTPATPRTTEDDFEDYLASLEPDCCTSCDGILPGVGGGPRLCGRCSGACPPDRVFFETMADLERDEPSDEDYAREVEDRALEAADRYLRRG